MNSLSHSAMPEPATDFNQMRYEAAQTLHRQVEDQDRQIVALRQQLAELSPFANVGSAILSKGYPHPQSAIADTDDPALQSVHQRSQIQAEQIAILQEQIADARRLAIVGEARLNKWRSRAFY
jgi:phycoerythrin-associated linker protein